MNLLHIDSSVLGSHSVSRQVTAAVVERLAKAQPGITVTYRDVGAEPLPHLSGLHLAAAQGAAVDADVQAELVTGQSVLNEFLAADIVVIGAPMYNFTIPTQLKAWIDRIAVAGKTFKYSAAGVEGLAGGKRVIIAVSRGNVYGTETPNAGYEHTETYLRSLFGFIGVTDIEIIPVDGIALSPEQREKSVSGALQAASDLRAA
jgi:FMN-dependent NADH-azoreductase